MTTASNNNEYSYAAIEQYSAPIGYAYAMNSMDSACPAQSNNILNIKSFETAFGLSKEQKKMLIKTISDKIIPKYADKPNTEKIMKDMINDIIKEVIEVKVLLDL